MNISSETKKMFELGVLLQCPKQLVVRKWWIENHLIEHGLSKASCVDFKLFQIYPIQKFKKSVIR